MSDNGRESLVKVRVELPEVEGISGESFWAKPLGGGLYELRNTPFFAQDLNWGDVVRCEEPLDERPIIVEVVRPSGHQTLWVIFAKNMSSQGRSRILKRLKDLGASYEHAAKEFYAIDVPPEADYEAVCDFLGEKAEEGKLEYTPGSTSP
jgi:hypothetical protein